MAEKLLLSATEDQKSSLYTILGLDYEEIAVTMPNGRKVIVNEKEIQIGYRDDNRINKFVKQETILI